MAGHAPRSDRADAGLRWYNVFTGEARTASEQDGAIGLRAAEEFAHFPFALLLAEP
jgi:hypothetical protein